MSYRTFVLDEYLTVEATNDLIDVEENHSDLVDNNIIDFQEVALKMETLNAFSKILSKSIIFD
ncbi:hypothetical protein MI048_19780 [Pantoea agglomerans]|uniref:hypothetical protein n=1 Tax=Enterobacter agglomerans TaxID=549 RepID=UPI00045D2AF9|nr:hypothetical protein [Pantoea agglomerans]KDA94331.1 hypothetical protein T296_11950 [Pantoea agglomerans Eh318]